MNQLIGAKMNRREMIANTLLVGAFSFVNGKKLLAEDWNTIKPHTLKHGDTVGIIAPGSAVSDPDDLQKAVEAVKLLGFNYIIAPNVEKGTGYKTRSIEERINDLHLMFESDVKAVMAIRGGYGTMDLLDKIDYELIRKHPKLFIGFSDVTALHIAFHQIAGLITFHGPVLLSSLSQYTFEHLRKAIYHESPLGMLFNPETKNGVRKAYPLRTVARGSSIGKLTGGNLSLIAATMGTSYEIDTKDRILFLEDVGEAPYSIDRMLNQMRLAGKFKDVKGIIWGHCNQCEDESGGVWDLSEGEVIDKYFSKLGVPVLSGLMIGHTPDQLTLPIGVEAELNADKQYLNIKESAFA